MTPFPPNPEGAYVTTLDIALWLLTEVSPYLYHVEASAIGLKPGHWPNFLRVLDTRQTPPVPRFSFARPTSVESPDVVIYTCGSVSLHVLND